MWYLIYKIWYNSDEGNSVFFSLLENHKTVKTEHREYFTLYYIWGPA